MHFEHLVLSTLRESRSTPAWSAAIQARIAEVTGDDAAMSMMGVGADFKEFRTMFAPRVDELQEQFIGPLDELDTAVSEAERELAALRQRQIATTTTIWSRYKTDYERYLHPEPLGDDDQEAPLEAPPEADPAAGGAGEPSTTTDRAPGSDEGTP
jgi:hypothetical protein